MSEDDVVHLLVSDAESNLIHAIRGKTDDDEDSPECFQKLKNIGTVQLKVSAGDRDLDDVYLVPATDLLFGCAHAGLKIKEKVLSPEWFNDAEAQTHVRSAAAEPQGNTDQGLSQSVNAHNFEEKVSWETIRSEVVPSYVHDVTFTIAGSELTDGRRRELDELFPDVAITVNEVPTPSFQALPGSNRSPKRQAALEYPSRKRNGVTTAVSDLEADTTSRDNFLEANVRKQDPGSTTATATNVPTGSTTLHRTAPVVDDVESHLQEFATSLTGYPPDGMFDVDVRCDETWGALPFSRKINIAHARAIQVGNYSETRAPATRCVNCKKNNYACKVYRHDFFDKVASTNHISLGEGCQHCRLLGYKCGLPSYRAHSASSPARNDSKNVDFPRLGRAYSGDPSSKATVTPQASGQLNLANRASTVHFPYVSDLGNAGFARKTDMTELAQQLGLTLARPDIIWIMYRAWRERESFSNYEPGMMPLQYYYLNLVHLHIMAQRIHYSKLEFATLLQFQITNFEQEDNLPDINRPVIEAFEFLPADAPLCRWIAIVFSYVWNTVEDGDYEAFHKKNRGLDPVALCKFLYAVAYVRDPHTQGGNLAVLQEWCSVHDHDAESAEDKCCMTAERACKNRLMSAGISPDKANHGTKKSRKRPFDGPSGPKHGKKALNRNGYQYDARPISRSSATKEKDLERDGSTGDDHDIDNGFADDLGVLTRSLGDAGSDGQKATTSAVQTVGTNTNPRRKRGRPRKNIPVDDASHSSARFSTEPRMLSGLMAMLSSEHLDALPFNSDFDLGNALNEGVTKSLRASTAERLPETPQRSITHSEGPTSERRSARTKAHPRGFFREHLPKSQFANTMWDVFKEE